jgi:hypothetical protein
MACVDPGGLGNVSNSEFGPALVGVLGLGGLVLAGLAFSRRGTNSPTTGAAV